MSLIKLGADSVGYYLEYVADGSERPGEWLGQGAKQLGLTGQVHELPLRNVYQGLHPDGSHQIVRIDAIRKDYKRTPGWDLCLSAPKDVSVIAGFYEDLGKKVAACKREAVLKTIEYLEREVAYVRRGKGGERLEKAKLIIAAFDHHTSRADQPQEHTHLLIMNAAARQGGFGTIVSRRIYDHQSAIQTVYLASLGIALTRDLPVRLEATTNKPFKLGEAFNIVGASEPLRKMMSLRRAQILAVRAKHGITTAKGMDWAARKTQTPKSHLPPSVLRPIWYELARSIGVEPEQMKDAILHPKESEAERVRVKPRAADGSSSSPEKQGANTSAEKTLAPDQKASKDAQSARQTANDSEKQQSPDSSRLQDEPGASATQAFTKSNESADRSRASAGPTFHGAEEKSGSEQNGKAGLEAGRGDGRADESMFESLLRSAKTAQLPDPLVDRLIDHAVAQYDRKHRPKKVGQIEKQEARAKIALGKVLKQAESLQQVKRHVVPREEIGRGLAGREGDAALQYVMSSTGAIACVHANAGSDSNALVAAMVKEYKNAGFRVKAFTATPNAASELQTAIGKPVHTVGQLSLRLRTSPLAAGAHHLLQIAKAATKQSTRGLWRFNGRNIVVVTQAQMIRTADLNKILTAAAAKKAKVVLIGADDKLVRREPHCAYDQVARKVGFATLNNPAVQKQAWMSDAVRQAALGDVRGAYSQFAMADRLHLSLDQKTATADLANYWSKLPRKERNTLMIADSDRDAAALNKAAQHYRRKSTFLPRFLRQKLQDGWVYRGDRILFHVGSRPLGIRAGDLGTIQRIGPNGMRIKLDRTRWAPLIRPAITVKVPKSYYKWMSLGYAIPASEAQGMSVGKALLLTNHNGDHIRGLTTQMSTAVEDARMFSTARAVGEDIEAFVKNQQKTEQEQRQKKKKSQESDQQSANRLDAQETDPRLKQKSKARESQSRSKQKQADQETKLRESRRHQHEVRP